MHRLGLLTLLKMNQGPDFYAGFALNSKIYAGMPTPILALFPHTRIPLSCFKNYTLMEVLLGMCQQQAVLFVEVWG